MRYDNWDIILFPEDSNIPIPEYKTACYLSRDEDGPELPTLRTYIGSLKPDTPIRISVHHWGPPKHSPLSQQVQRKAGSDIAFTVQVFINGTRLYHGSFGVNTSSPQEIAFEQRSYRSSPSHEQPASKPKQRLLFPRNDKTALLQSAAWQPRGTDNRIKIILSERLINADGSLGANCWDIVCFSFQHAPRELLEQAGIAYPIIDPLRALVNQQATTVPCPNTQKTAARDLPRHSRVHTEHSPESAFEPFRPTNPEPLQQPRTRIPSKAMYPPHPMGHRSGEIPGLWPNPYQPFIDDDISMGSWPSQRHASNMTGLESFCGSSAYPYAGPPWPHGTAVPDSHIGFNIDGAQRRKHSQQVLMAMRNDQFGQILEAISPSKKPRSNPNDPSQLNNQNHRPPKMGALSVPVRPASAAIARSGSSSDLKSGLRNSIRRPSSDQASFSVTASFKRSAHPTGNKENQMPTATMYDPFLRASQPWDSDVSMRDGSSNFSSHSKSHKDPARTRSKIDFAHAPPAAGEVRSRKEGLVTDTSESLDTNVRHHENVLPKINTTLKPKAQCDADDSKTIVRHESFRGDQGISDDVEVIDVDAIDPDLVAGTTVDLAKLSPFKPGHTAGMSSISSTERLERQLYSALGEELGSFEQELNTPGMGTELAQALSGRRSRSSSKPDDSHDALVRQPEVVTKRKRQGTLGGERDPNPTKKKEKVQEATVEDADLPEDIPRLRGD